MNIKSHLRYVRIPWPAVHFYWLMHRDVHIQKIFRKHIYRQSRKFSHISIQLLHNCRTHREWQTTTKELIFKQNIETSKVHGCHWHLIVCDCSLRRNALAITNAGTHTQLAQMYVCSRCVNISTWLVILIYLFEKILLNLHKWTFYEKRIGAYIGAVYVIKI